MDWIKSKNKNGQSWQVVFYEPPKSMDMLLSMPEANLKDPHYAAGLLIPALCLWSSNQELALDMINFLKGPQGLSPYEIQFINDRLRGKEYVPFSYFEGSTPKNGYEPSRPYTVTVYAMPTSFDEVGYAKVYLKSSGADSPRPVKLRQKSSTGQWFITEQMLLADIRLPLSEDPWA